MSNTCRHGAYLTSGPCERCSIVALQARIAELEAGIRAIIAYEWGKPSDGYEVAPSGHAAPSEQVAWRALEALVVTSPLASEGAVKP